MEVLLASASANHARLRQLEDVIASLTKAAQAQPLALPPAPAPHQSKSDAKQPVEKSWAEWRPVLVCSLFLLL